MIFILSVSENFKEQQKASSRRYYCKIEWSQIDVDVNADCTVSSAFTDSFSDTDQLIDLNYNTSNRYATLERLLLNSQYFLADENIKEDKTWWSDDICGSDGYFLSFPTITFNFTKDHFNPGLTIIWDLDNYEYAIEFTIRIWLDGSYQDVVVTDNSSFTYVLLVPYTYDKIELTVKKWSNNYRRARISEFLFGVLQTYDRFNKLIEIEVNESVDLLNSQIFSNKLNFSIDNIDHAYDILNPSGTYQYLQENQEITVSIATLNNNIYEWISLGKFYLTGWEGNSNDIEARFTAESIFYKTYIDYYKSVYGIYTAYELIEDILIECGFKANEYYIDTNLQDTTIVGYLKLGQAKDLLATLALTALATVYEDRNGVLRFERLLFIATDETISKDEAFKYPNIELLQNITGVQVKYYRYKFDASTELFNQTFTNSETQIIVDYEPSIDQILTLTNATLVNSTFYCQRAIINITSITGNVGIKIDGKKIVDNATIIGNGNCNIDVNTITDYDTALLIQAYVNNYYSKRVTSTIEWKQNPYLVTCDRVLQDTQFSNQIDGIIIENNYKFNGGFLGTTKLKEI